MRPLGLCVDGAYVEGRVRRQEDYVPAKLGFWSNRSHYLDKMTLRELIVAYFQYYAIQAYILLAVGAAVAAVMTAESAIPNLIAALTAVLLYPVAWYFIHRYILHGTWLAKSPLTARVWKRVHYDHHQDPQAPAVAANFSVAAQRGCGSAAPRVDRSPAAAVDDHDVAHARPVHARRDRGHRRVRRDRRR